MRIIIIIIIINNDDCNDNDICVNISVLWIHRGQEWDLMVLYPPPCLKNSCTLRLFLTPDLLHTSAPTFQRSAAEEGKPFRQTILTTWKCGKETLSRSQLHGEVESDRSASALQHT